jgi:hypothetical protein
MRVIALLTMFLAFPSFASPAPEGGRFTRLQEGSPAKFDSWCYDDFANAQIISKLKFADEKCALKLDHELEKERARSNLTISNLKLRIDTLTSQNEQIIKIKDKEINRLTEIVSKTPNDYSLWWASGGFISGIAVSILIFSVAK